MAAGPKVKAAPGKSGTDLGGPRNDAGVSDDPYSEWEVGQKYTFAGFSPHVRSVVVTGKGVFEFKAVGSK